MNQDSKPNTQDEDPRISRSRRALLDAGIELFLINPMASLSEVAAHAGVGRATLYRHFRTRNQLIQALAKESLDMTDNVVHPAIKDCETAKQALQAMIQVIMPLADRFHFILSLWTVSEEGDPALDVYNRQLEDLGRLVERAKKEGSINKRLDTNWIVHIIDGLLYAGWWVVHTGEMTAEQAADHACETLFNGVGA